MSTWPDKPLIRIIRGEENFHPIRNTLATRDGDSYIVASGSRAGNSISRDYATDHIFEWEEVTAVPTAALEDFKAAWKGFGMYDPDDSQRVTDAITSVLSCLPADKPSALDRAVTRVKDIAGGRMIDAESTQEERLSLLLDALASVQSAARKAVPLAMVARICADWADLEDPCCGALESARGKGEAISITGDFTALTSLVGHVATALRENYSPRHDLIYSAAYALAWASQIIEEEDK